MLYWLAGVNLLKNVYSTCAVTNFTVSDIAVYGDGNDDTTSDINDRPC